jgi:hypothetical protein
MKLRKYKRSRESITPLLMDAKCALIPILIINSSTDLKISIPPIASKPK